MELEDVYLGDRPRFIRFVRNEVETIKQTGEKISKKNLVKLVTEKWNELHPDMKVNKAWVYWIIYWPTNPK